MACENNTVNEIVKALDKKLAEDITVLNVSSLTTLADYFVIATGKNDKQTKALCDYVEEELDKLGISPVNKEGYRTGDWILLGYNEVVIHIFQPEARDFYNLDKLYENTTAVEE